MIVVSNMAVNGDKHYHREEKNRFVFGQGDFIVYHGTKLGRLDNIFLFIVWGDEHMFAIITPMERTD